MRKLMLFSLLYVLSATVAWAAAGNEDQFAYTLTLFLHQALFVF